MWNPGSKHKHWSNELYVCVCVQEQQDTIQSISKAHMQEYNWNLQIEKIKKDKKKNTQKLNMRLLCQKTSKQIWPAD